MICFTYVTVCDLEQSFISNRTEQIFLLRVDINS